jgi:hypothetical protein
MLSFDAILSLPSNNWNEVACDVKFIGRPEVCLKIKWT